MEKLRTDSTGDNIENKEGLKTRILYAEDDQLFRGLIFEILTMKGYEVKSVENGQLLLDELKQNQYDLILTDNNMPLMTGLQALKKIRSDEQTKNIPVIVLSADLIEKKVTELGGIYIGKPVDEKKLTQQIDKLVEDSKTIK
jgi:CheY-like chemotaxis protein